MNLKKSFLVAIAGATLVAMTGIAASAVDLGYSDDSSSTVYSDTDSTSTGDNSFNTVAALAAVAAVSLGTVGSVVQKSKNS